MPTAIERVGPFQYGNARPRRPRCLERLMHAPDAHAKATDEFIGLVARADRVADGRDVGKDRV